MVSKHQLLLHVAMEGCTKGLFWTQGVKMVSKHQPLLHMSIKGCTNYQGVVLGICCVCGELLRASTLKEFWIIETTKWTNLLL
jgi:hypothetical protein